MYTLHIVKIDANHTLYLVRTRHHPIKDYNSHKGHKRQIIKEKMPRQTSIKDAKDNLSVFVNMVAHGHERVVLTSRGRPKAALIGLDDLAALEDLTVNPTTDDSALAEADSLKERILRRRHGVLVTDSAKDLAAIRDAER